MSQKMIQIEGVSDLFHFGYTTCLTNRVTVTQLV